MLFAGDSPLRVNRHSYGSSNRGAASFQPPPPPSAATSSAGSHFRTAGVETQRATAPSTTASGQPAGDSAIVPIAVFSGAPLHRKDYGAPPSHLGHGSRQDSALEPGQGAFFRDASPVSLASGHFYTGGGGLASATGGGPSATNVFHLQSDGGAAAHEYFATTYRRAPGVWSVQNFPLELAPSHGLSGARATAATSAGAAAATCCLFDVTMDCPAAVKYAFMILSSHVVVCGTYDHCCRALEGIKQAVMYLGQDARQSYSVSPCSQSVPMAHATIIVIDQPLQVVAPRGAHTGGGDGASWTTTNTAAPPLHPSVIDVAMSEDASADVNFKLRLLAASVFTTASVMRCPAGDLPLVRREVFARVAPKRLRREYAPLTVAQWHDIVESTITHDVYRTMCDEETRTGHHTPHFLHPTVMGGSGAALHAASLAYAAMSRAPGASLNVTTNVEFHGRDQVHSALFAHAARRCPRLAGTTPLLAMNDVLDEVVAQNRRGNASTALAEALRRYEEGLTAALQQTTTSSGGGPSRWIDAVDGAHHAVYTASSDYYRSVTSAFGTADAEPLLMRALVTYRQVKAASRQANKLLLETHLRAMLLEEEDKLQSGRLDSEHHNLSCWLQRVFGVFNAFRSETALEDVAEHNNGGGPHQTATQLPSGMMLDPAASCRVLVDLLFQWLRPNSAIIGEYFEDRRQQELDAAQQRIAQLEQQIAGIRNAENRPDSPKRVAQANREIYAATITAYQDSLRAADERFRNLVDTSLSFCEDFRLLKLKSLKRHASDQFVVANGVGPSPSFSMADAKQALKDSAAAVESLGQRVDRFRQTVDSTFSTFRGGSAPVTPVDASFASVTSLAQHPPLPLPAGAAQQQPLQQHHQNPQVVSNDGMDASEHQPLRRGRRGTNDSTASDSVDHSRDSGVPTGGGGGMHSEPTVLQMKQRLQSALSHVSLAMKQPPLPPGANSSTAGPLSRQSSPSRGGGLLRSGEASVVLAAGGQPLLSGEPSDLPLLDRSQGMQLRGNATMLERAIEEHRRRHADQEAIIAQVRGQLADASDENIRLVADNRVMRVELTRLRHCAKDLEEVSKHLTEAEGRIRKVEAEREEANRQRLDAERQIESLTSVHRQQTTMIAKLTGERHNLVAEIDTLKAAIANSDAQLEALRCEHEMVKTSFEIDKAALDKALSERSVLAQKFDEEHLQFVTLSNRYDVDVARLQGDLAVARAEAREHADATERRYTERLQTIEQQLRDLTAKHASVSSDYNHARDTIEQKATDIAVLSREKGEIRAQLEAQGRDVEMLTQTVVELKSSLQIYEMKCAAQGLDLEQNEHKLHEIQDAYARMQQELTLTHIRQTAAAAAVPRLSVTRSSSQGGGQPGGTGDAASSGALMQQLDGLNATAEIVQQAAVNAQQACQLANRGLLSVPGIHGHRSISPARNTTQRSSLLATLPPPPTFMDPTATAGQYGGLSGHRIASTLLANTFSARTGSLPNVAAPLGTASSRSGSTAATRELRSDPTPSSLAHLFPTPAGGGGGVGHRGSLGSYGSGGMPSAHPPPPQSIDAASHAGSVEGGFGGASRPQPFSTAPPPSAAAYHQRSASQTSSRDGADTLGSTQRPASQQEPSGGAMQHRRVARGLDAHQELLQMIRGGGPSADSSSSSI